MPEADYKRLLMIIGKNIKSERTVQGISKTTLAQMTGYNRNNLAHLEDGSQDIKLETLLKVAKALDVSPIQLCMRTYEIDRNSAVSKYLEDNYLLVFRNNVRERLKALHRMEYAISSNRGEIDQTTVSRILKGKIKNPKISTLNEIAYGVKSDFAVLLRRS